MMPQKYLISHKQVPYVIAVQSGIGGVGTGKSLTEIWFAEVAHACGYKVCTNIESMKVPHTDFYSTILPYLDEILAGEMESPERTLYCLDDINKMWESRRSMGAVEVKLSQFIQDVRKNPSGERDKASFCIYSAPHITWGDVRLWDIADVLIYTSFDEDTSRLYWVMVDADTKTILNVLNWDARPLFDRYNSYQKIRSPPPEVFEEIEHVKKIEPWFCPRCESSQTKPIKVGSQKGKQLCSRCNKVFEIKWRGGKHGKG